MRQLPNAAFVGFVTTMISSSTVFSLRLCYIARNARPTARLAKKSTTASTTMRLLSSADSNNTPSMLRSSSISSSISSASAKTYRLDGIGVSGGTRVETTTSTGHSIITDIPKSMGGGDTAPQPVETLLGAWMGCTQATASFVGRQLLLERTRKNKHHHNQSTSTEHTTKQHNSSSSSPQKDRPRRPPRMEILLEFDSIEAVRDETGALELPIRKTPSVPSLLQRITGIIKVSLVPVIQNGSKPASSSSSSSSAAVFLDPEELEVLKEQTEARCPIANMLMESGCAMEVEWIQERNNL